MNHINTQLTIDEFKILEKKVRSVIYKYKEDLIDVLRYNSWWTIIPYDMEKKVRSKLKDIRDNQTNLNTFIVWSNDNTIVANKVKNVWTFKTENKELHSIKNSWNTYLHTGNQAIWLYKYGKMSLQSWDIDEYQFILDLIRAELHDLSEYITDDIPPFEKTKEYRKWEKDVEHEIIMNENIFSDKEKNVLKEILNYKKNSIFKTYEHLFCIEDAINMHKWKEKYNEVLSVIYEILKFNLPRFLWQLELNNWHTTDMLNLSWIRTFFVENMKKIDELFIFVKENKKELFSEHRFKNNPYNKSDLWENFEDLKKPREEIKSKIKHIESEK